MKNLKNIVISNIIILFLVNVTFAISVVENSPTAVAPPPASSGLADVIAGGVVIGIGVGVFIGIIIFVIYLITSKIKENKRKHSDLLYSKFLIELEKCHQNRDTKLKYRNWKTFFLTFKRSDIILDTVEDGIKVFGKYDGEVIIKDNFYLIAIYRVTGIFSREKDIVIIPYQLRKLVKKERHNSKFEMIIGAESIDEALNTDYYAQLVIKSHLDDNKLINFNEYIMDKYMRKYVMRQVIKEDLLDFKDSMSKVIELNPTINFERKNPRN